MQKTYINYFKTKTGFLSSSEYKSAERAKEYLDCYSLCEYLFTLEINENGEPRTFKHELPKEPVKSYINFYSYKNDALVYTGTYKNFEAAKAARNTNINISEHLFTRCFDETGKEYPIEEE